MKKIITIGIVILLTSLVYADTEFDVTLQTDQDLDSNINTFSEGETDTNINIESLDDVDTTVNSYSEGETDLNTNVFSMEDVDANTNINAQGDIDFNANLNAGGDMDVNINGINLNAQSTYFSAVNIYQVDSLPEGGMGTMGDGGDTFDIVITGANVDSELNALNNAIRESGTTGGTMNLVVRKIIGAVQYLVERDALHNKQEVLIGRALDAYFASDNDVRVLMNNINILSIRIEALENTMEVVAEAEYCRGKLEVMEKYHLRHVSCGEKNFYNHLVDPSTGEDIVIIIENIKSEVDEDNTTEE